MSREYVVGETYVTQDGFSYPGGDWRANTGLAEEGDSFICEKLNGCGDAIHIESGDIYATYSELQDGTIRVKVQEITELPRRISLDSEGNMVGEMVITNPSLAPNWGGQVTSCESGIVNLGEPMEDSDVFGVLTAPAVTGGSSPSYYRKSIMLPLTEDRTKFALVDLEAFDVSNAWDMNANAFNVFKSTVRGDNKPGVDHEYALDKQLWFTLTEKLRRDLITTEQFWQMAVALGISKDV